MTGTLPAKIFRFIIQIFCLLSSRGRDFFVVLDHFPKMLLRMTPNLKIVFYIEHALEHGVQSKQIKDDNTMPSPEILSDIADGNNHLIRRLRSDKLLHTSPITSEPEHRNNTNDDPTKRRQRTHIFKACKNFSCSSLDQDSRFFLTT